jgi:ubiquitin carboxyl-terminal hydrolase 36/42
MSGKGDKPPLYHLFAVVVHVGILASDSGHYICYVKNSLGIWYKVDDRKVKSAFCTIFLSY